MISAADLLYVDPTVMNELYTLHSLVLFILVIFDTIYSCVNMSYELVRHKKIFQHVAIFGLWLDCRYI